MDKEKDLYVLEEKWYNEYFFVSSSPDIDWIIQHMEELQRRAGKFCKITFRIRLWDDDESNKVQITQ